ncbi:MAG: xanthine dehydrogenase family protein subunit M [Chloroflexota bacterium]
MKPFTIQDASNQRDASQQVGDAVFLAGGTTLVDLMKLDLQRPDRIINLLPLREKLNGIRVDEAGLTIGALVTMSELMDHSIVQERYAVMYDALRLAASAQIRNAATIGGNLLQRTRCAYYRDKHAACNKHSPGSGCAATGGDSRGLAILGTSKHCIANYAGDLAVALVALDASVTTADADGAERKLKVEDLHRLPGDQPHIETNLKPGELITHIHVPHQTWDKTLYHKVRDRASYAFALTSAAVALRRRQEVIDEVRIALGGLATKPWRCRAAEAYLQGKALTMATATKAAELCLEGAQTDSYRAFKVELGKRTVIRALLNVNNF